MKYAKTCFLFGALCCPAACAPQVKLGTTTLIGQALTNTPDVEFFGGIPFAEAPVGPRRFSPPVLKTSLQVPTFNATQFGASCLQTPPANNESEDCLTINIARPAGLPANASLPVMFNIYGGGFHGGTASDFDGRYIVEQSISRGTPVLHINFNYRLGLLGFPQGKEATRKGALNLGLKDMIAAMQWVQHNVAVFGGDKDQVTVFGESAGGIAISILYLNSNPPLNTLARAAIVQSGGPDSVPLMKESEHETNWQHFISAIPECADASPEDTFDCARRANSSTISLATAHSRSQSNSPYGFVPLVDGPDGVYPDHPSRLYKQGNFARIPFISGTNKDEGTPFVETSTNTDAQVHESIIRNFSLACYPPSVQNSVANKIMELYPNDPALGSPFGTGKETFGFNPQVKRQAAILGDIMFQAPSRAFATALSGYGVKAYRYYFTDPSVGIPAYWGVAHGQDCQYLYPAHHFLGSDVPKPPSSLQLASDMRDYLISFATSLDPNDGGGNAQRPRWPQYHSNNQTILQLEGGNIAAVPNDFRQAAIGYLISKASALQESGVPVC